jgi:hypothetical protein
MLRVLWLVEIYNEKVYDLLNEEQGKKKLVRVRCDRVEEDQNTEDLSERVIEKESQSNVTHKLDPQPTHKEFELSDLYHQQGILISTT